MLEIVNVADLRRDCHTFAISSPDVSVIEQRLIRCATVATVNKVAADHNSSAALTRFAVDGNGALITRKVVFNRRQELLDDIIGRDGAINEEEIIMSDA